MVHYTCDLCGKELRAGAEARYILKIETSAAQDPAELTAADLEDDHLEVIGAMLQEMEDGETADLPATNKKLQYDLCADCHQRYLRDPLGKKQPTIVFNEN